MKDEKQLKEDEHSFDTGIKKLAGIGRLSPLRRYLFVIGKNPNPREISKEELDKIVKSSRYKQWKILRKLQHMATEIKKRKGDKVNEENIQEVAPPKPPRLDVGDPNARRHVRHRTHRQKLKFINQQAIDAMNRGIGDLHRDPTTMITKNPKAKHAFLAMGKGKIMVRKKIGHRPQITFRVQEDITMMAKDDQPQTDNKKDIVRNGVSDKTQKLLDKSKEIKLKTGTIEINPQLHSKSSFDRKD